MFFNDESLLKLHIPLPHHNLLVNSIDLYVLIWDQGLEAVMLRNMAEELCVTHALQPLSDLSVTENFHRSQRSQQGPRSVPARLQRSRRLVGDLSATKSVAYRSRLGRRPVPDHSPTDRRPILLESGRGYH